MIFAAFTNNFRKVIPLLPILAIAAVLRIYKIADAFPFDFDQTVPANAAYQFFINHRISLIGQELSFLGFFLGPLHNWIQFIPYGFCNLLPDCVPYFYILIGLVTIVILYHVVKKIFDRKTATIVCIIYAVSFAAISFERGVSSNYFLFLSSVGILFCAYKYFAGENKCLILGALIAGIATVNFNPVFIFSTIAFATTALFRKKRSLSIFTVATGAFLINYLPLVIFNFRHDNILLEGIQNFANQNVSQTQFLDKIIHLAKDVMMPFYSNYLFGNANTIPVLATLSLIVFGLYLTLKSQNIFLYLLPFWIIIPVVGLSFYSGHIPDYYFSQSLLPFIVLIADAVRKNIIIFLIFITIFLFGNINAAVNYKSGINYQIKREVVNFILDDTQGASFNVYYDLPPGFNTGYDYLFKVLGQSPQEGGKNLYILEFVDPHIFDITKYYRSFPDKFIDLNVIGFVYIVSVK